MIALCIAVTLLSRSSTTAEIDTFMTVLSSTMTNWAAPRISTTNHFFICPPDSAPARVGACAHSTPSDAATASRREGDASHLRIG